MKFFYAIVSHGHSEMIMKNKELKLLVKQKNTFIIIKDNIGEEALESFCKNSGIQYINYSKGLGFGANNNAIFEFVNTEFETDSLDYFIIINPDVYLNNCYSLKLHENLEMIKPDVATIDLFRDFTFTIRDPFIRRYPSLMDFLKSFILKKNSTVIDRTKLIRNIDWCAGSFICFSLKTYRELNGFDEGYFMYCEDIDICFRAAEASKKILYFDNVKATHLAQHQNSKLFSKHFYWHVKSMIRYLVMYYGLRPPLKVKKK